MTLKVLLLIQVALPSSRPSDLTSHLTLSPGCSLGTSHSPAHLPSLGLLRGFLSVQFCPPAPHSASLRLDSLPTIASSSPSRADFTPTYFSGASISLSFQCLIPRRPPYFLALLPPSPVHSPIQLMDLQKCKCYHRVCSLISLSGFSLFPYNDKNPKQGLCSPAWVRPACPAYPSQARGPPAQLSTLAFSPGLRDTVNVAASTCTLTFTL